jgi:hypothetical protein
MNAISSGTKIPQPKRHVSTSFPTAIFAILSFDTIHKFNDFESVLINKLEKSILVCINWLSQFRKLDAVCCENLSKTLGKKLKWYASDIASTVNERIKGLTVILLCVFLYVIPDKWSFILSHINGI